MIDEPAAVLVGCVPNTSCVAVPLVMLKALLVANVNPELVADNVYPLPLLLIERPLKVAMPLTAF